MGIQTSFFQFYYAYIFWAKTVFNSINPVFNNTGLHVNISTIWE